MIVLYFLFHGLHIATTLRVLKHVICFHMASSNYGPKGKRDVDPAYRSNLWLNLFACFFLFALLCVCLGVIFWAPFIRRD